MFLCNHFIESYFIENDYFHKNIVKLGSLEKEGGKFVKSILKYNSSVMMFISRHSVLLHRNLLSHFLHKNFVKATFLSKQEH